MQSYEDLVVNVQQKIIQGITVCMPKAARRMC